MENQVENMVLKKLDAVVDYISNVELRHQKESEKISERLDVIEKILSEIAEQKKKKIIYTDEELRQLKEQLSWTKLSERTGIKVSTLQYRVRNQRKKEMFADMEV